MSPLASQASSFDIPEVFYVGYLLAAGYLIVRATFLPRVLGVLLAIGAVCYLTYALADFLSPEFAAHLVPYIQVPSGLAELALCLWLLVMGVNTRRWKEQAREQRKSQDDADLRPASLLPQPQKETRMKAIVYARYGSPDVLQLKEVEKPVPKDGEVLVEVHAASVNALDRHTLKSGSLLIRAISRNGLLKPKDPRLGADLAGHVAAIGSAVTRFQPGDEVFGVGSGGFAEYACAPEKTLALKPAHLSFEAAAATPVGALTALQGLRDKGQIQPGQRVVISGASGAVGSFAVQIARSFGAEVTAVCSTRNVEMARSIGADHVIDYTREDFTRNGQRYDLILAVNGYHSIFAYRRALRPGARYVFVGEGSNAHLFRAMFQAMLLGPLLSTTSGRKLGFMGIAKVNHDDLAFLAQLLEAGKIVPVIDRCYPLPDTAEAFRYLENEHAQGKVVITI